MKKSKAPQPLTQSGQAYTAASLLAAIQGDLPSLSDRLRQAGTYVLDHPNDVALQSITALSARAAVQPSVFIRFAKHFGFNGFSDFQRVFRLALAEQAPSYGERIKQLQRELPETGAISDPAQLLRQFATVNERSLSHLADNIEADGLMAFVEAIDTAEDVFIIGQRRSHIVASYLAYALTRAGKRTRLLAGAGGTLKDEMRLIRPCDVIIAITMQPYSAEVIDAANFVQKIGAPLLALTDTNFGPLEGLTHSHLVVRDVDFMGFRSVVAQMCLVQSIAISLAARQV